MRVLIVKILISNIIKIFVGISLLKYYFNAFNQLYMHFIVEKVPTKIFCRLVLGL
jgi:hypothetical protein